MDHLQQLRNLKDFLLVYNRMTEICFQRCTTNFNYRALTMDEERCVDSCAGKLIRSNHRLMGTYVQLMPKMMQRRMDELESKAAEVAKAEAAQAASAGVEQAAVPIVPDPAATDVPVSILSPDMAAPVTTVDAPPLPLSVPEVTGAVPDLSSASPPAADMPVMNGPSLTNAVGNSALLFAPPPPLPEVSGAVGLVTGLTESPVIPSEASVAVPIAVEGPSTHMSLPSVTELPAQGSVLSTSGEKMIPSPLELPSTVPPTQPVTIPSIESKIVVPDLPKATSDATAPIVVPVLKPSIESKIVVPDLTKASSDATASILAPVTNGVPVTSTSTSTAASTSEGSQSSS